MTNEELAVLVRDGDDSKFPLLWEQTRRYVYLRASHRMRQVEGLSLGVTWEDLVQAGALAVLTAARSYDLDGGAKFLTYLEYHIKKEFGKACQSLNQKRRLDPLIHSVSFSAFRGEDGEEMDVDSVVIIDKNGEAPYRAIEDRDQNDALASALRIMIDALPPKQQVVIRRRYYANDSYDAISADLGISKDAVHRLENAALRQFRHPKYDEPLRQALNS